MVGQMAWLSATGSQGEKILHLRLRLNQPWQPYTAFAHLAVPDYNVPGGSKGWATYQKLLKANWKLIASSEAERSITMLTLKSA